MGGTNLFWALLICVCSWIWTLMSISHEILQILGFFFIFSSTLINMTRFDFLVNCNRFYFWRINLNLKLGWIDHWARPQMFCVCLKKIIVWNVSRWVVMCMKNRRQPRQSDNQMYDFTKRRKIFGWFGLNSMGSSSTNDSVSQLLATLQSLQMNLGFPFIGFIVNCSPFNVRKSARSHYTISFLQHEMHTSWAAHFFQVLVKRQKQFWQFIFPAYLHIEPTQHVHSLQLHKKNVWNENAMN